jgi:hypothetical protein
MTSSPQTANVVVNAQSELTFDLQAVVAPPPEKPKPAHTKRIIGIVALVVAGGAAVASGVLGGLYGADSSTWHDYASGVPTTETRICSDGSTQNRYPTGGGNPPVHWGDACAARSRATTEGSIAWAAGGAAIGLALVGVVLIVMDKPDKEGAATARFRVVPSISPTGAGVSALLSF